MQTKFTKLLSLLLVSCLLLATAMPTLAANPSATLSSTTMTEDGSITVTFSDEATGYNGIYYDVQVIENGNWSSPYFAEAWVTSGTTYTISGDNLGVTFSASSTYQIYIGYWNNGIWQSDALSTTSITVTDGSSTSNPTASLDSTTMTESGSITVTFTQEASTTAYYKIEIAPDESGSWGTKILEETVTSGTTFTINKTTVSALTAGSTYHIYIGYYEGTTFKSNALADTTFTVTEDGGGTHNYQLSVALDDSKLEKDGEDNPVYPYVYDSTDTTVNVTVTVTENGNEVTELDSNYSVYVWFEDDKGNDNAIKTVTEELETGCTITGTIDLENSSYSFTTGTNYNVYARVDYNNTEVNGSMEGTSFTINTTYTLVLQMDTAKLDSDTGIYVYDLEDTANVTVSFASVISGTAGTSSTTIPDGTMLTIWYEDDSGWSDLTFDLGSRVHSSDAYGENPTTLELSSSSFTAGKIYTMGAGLYNEGGETLAIMEVQFTFNQQASFYTRTLTLDGDIGVNYYVDMTGVSEDDMQKYTVVFTGDGISHTATFNAGSYRDDFNGDTKYYRFTVTVDSTQMATSFTAVLQYNDTTVQSNTYSVESYCKWAITNNKAEQAICAALLNYGGYSQTYFESTGTLANANLDTYFAAAGTWSDPVASEFTADLSSYKVKISEDMPSEITANSFSASLVLKSQTVIRIYFNASSTEGLTVKVGNEELTIVDAGSGSYYVEYEVQASKLGSTIDFTVTDGTTTGTVSYSAYAYIYSTLGDTHSAYDADESLVNVCKALYYYGEAAKEYSNWYKGTT